MSVRVKVKIGRNKIADVIDTMRGFKKMEVGFFGGNAYPNGLTVAGNAAIHNFGTKNIPARPFMDDAATEIEKSQPQVGKIYRAAIESDDPSIANQRIGAFCAQKIREAIRSGSYAALKPATKKRKGSSKPLIDTGLLIGSVDFKEN